VSLRHRTPPARAPALRIDDEGIHDHANLASAGLIRWEEIRDLEVQKTGRQRHLALVLADTEAVLARQGAPKRLWARLTRRMTGHAFHIPLADFDIPEETLIAAICEYRTASERRKASQAPEAKQTR
jgi:hypothetical protein